MLKFSAVKLDIIYFSRSESEFKGTNTLHNGKGSSKTETVY